MTKLGLCLAGGGARGAFQTGVMKALNVLGIAPKLKAFSGTSIGSVNASFFATKPIEEVIAIWEEMTPEHMRRTESYFRNLIHERVGITKTGLYDISDLETLLKTQLDTRMLKEKDVFVTIAEGGTTNEGFFGLLKASYQHYIKKDTKAIYIPLCEQDETAMVQYILASCSIPLVFPAVSIGTTNYFDGGLYDNVPVKPLIEAGCDEIIIVHLHRLNFFDPDKHPGIVFHEIQHKGALGGILNFDPERAKNIIQLGYDDAMAYFGEHPIH
jgi:NTE family protein